MSIKPKNGFTWEPVAVALAKGVDLRTRARLVDAPKLLAAENVAFPASAGVSKRYGHVGRTVMTRGAIPAQTSITGVATDSGLEWNEPFDEKTLPANWLYGYGLFDPTDPVDHNTSPGRANVSQHPSAGILCGAATRDNEEIVWDGFRLFSSPTSVTNQGPFGEPEKAALCPSSLACPVARTTPIAKGGTTQTFPSVADTGVIKTVVWIEGTTVYANVYDSLTESPLRTRVNLATETGLTITPYAVRSVPVGQFIHILVSETANHKLYRITVSVAALGATMTSADLGSCQGPFDVRKVSDTTWAVVIEDTSSNIVITYLSANGAAVSSPAPQRTVLQAAGGGDLHKWPSFDINPVSSEICLLWWVDFGDPFNRYIKARKYTSSGIPITAATIVATVASSLEIRLTVASLYLRGNTVTQGHAFALYWEADNGSGIHTVNTQLFNSGGLSGSAISREGLYLASQAFRVGNTAFVFATYKSPLQSTHFLMDIALLPVGRLEYGTAYVQTGTTGWLMPVNFKDGAAEKDRAVFHTAIQYNLRLEGTKLARLAPGTSKEQPVFAETSVKECNLDFLPRLRSAQAGRATYFAGAQLWQYDGRQCTEAGFHLGPELSTVADSATAGSLVAAQKYRYYIQMAYRNAQGEEIRGPGFLLDEFTVGGGKTSLDISLPYIQTRRADAYYLIYRNEDVGTLWYLVSSRDPSSASCPKNGTGVVFNDGMSNTTLITKELAPANPSGYLETYSAPSCEIVASGRDRLWVSGGECPAGQVFPSRLFYPSQAPSFHPGLGILVDRGPDPITAIGFVEESVALFRRDHAYLLEGDGIDNLSTGAWPPVRLAQAEVGAVSQESLGLTPLGLFFQSPSGIKMLRAGGEILPVGMDVDPLAKDLHVSASLVIPDDQQVRFYSADGNALVYDYLQDCWTVWTGVRCWGAVRSPGQRRALLARPDGFCWAETKDVYNDAGGTYRLRVRTSWLHGGTLGGFQRVRRVGVLGELPGGHFTLTARLFYDENAFPAEERTWATSADLNTAAWGELTWGSTSAAALAPGVGVWGDTSTVGALRENVFRIRYRTARQKCSAICIELDDNAVDGPGFIGTAILLEVGVRAGIDRIPWRTTTQTVFVEYTGAKNSNRDGANPEGPTVTVTCV